MTGEKGGDVEEAAGDGEAGPSTGKDCDGVLGFDGSGESAELPALSLTCAGLGGSLSLETPFSCSGLALSSCEDESVCSREGCEGLSVGGVSSVAINR